jgi:hypothetical protein
MHDFSLYFVLRLYTCFGVIFSPSSGGGIGTSFILMRLSAGLDEKETAVYYHSYYTLGPLMMG